MKNKKDKQWSDEEMNWIESSKKEINPPFGLEERIVQNLYNKNLITNNNTIMKKSNLIWVAATITTLICGIFIGKGLGNSEAVQDGLNQYVLFLYENDEFKGDMSLVAEYSKWAQDLYKDDKLVNAEKLSDNNHWLGNESVKNANSFLSGYFILKANTLEEAMTIAKTHPHTGYGGGIEVRPIEKLN